MIMYVITKSRSGSSIREFVGVYTSKVQAIKALRENIIRNNPQIFKTYIICNKSTGWEKVEDFNYAWSKYMTRSEIYDYLYNAHESGIIETFGTRYTISENTPNMVKVD